MATRKESIESRVAVAAELLQPALAKHSLPEEFQDRVAALTGLKTESLTPESAETWAEIMFDLYIDLQEGV